MKKFSGDYYFAEGTRFELVVGLLLRQFSKLVVSATHPPLQKFSKDNQKFPPHQIFPQKISISQKNYHSRIKI